MSRNPQTKTSQHLALLVQARQDLAQLATVVELLGRDVDELEGRLTAHQVTVHFRAVRSVTAVLLSCLILVWLEYLVRMHVLSNYFF